MVLLATLAAELSQYPAAALSRFMDTKIQFKLFILREKGDINCFLITFSGNVVSSEEEKVLLYKWIKINVG